MIVEVKHPMMRDRATDVRNTLEQPEQIRRSRSDPAVYLYYRSERPGRWICVVVKQLNEEGFLVTTYPTDAIKEGEKVWGT